jgi:hypothetical protein
VSVFVELLRTTELHYRHGEDADFDAELGMKQRVERYAAGLAPGSR